DERGRFRAEHAIAAPAPVEQTGVSEIDPENWWTLLVDAADALRAADRNIFDAVDGVAICGVTRTQVFLGANGRLLRPAITWRDTRATGRHDLPADHPETAEINAFHPLARLAWLKREEPTAFRALQAIVDP